jgi:hypothetical protein
VGDGAVRVEEPALDGGERRRSGDHPVPGGLGGGARVDGGGELGDRLVQEDVLRGQPEPDEPGPGHHLDAEDGVPAQGEEVALHAHLLGTEHVGPDARQLPLRRGARRHELRSGGCGVRCGQGPAVELAVGVERQPVEEHERGGHHVVGEGPHEVGPQRGGVGGGAGRRHDVGDEALASGLVLAGDDDGLGELVAAQQRGLDLAQLDPEPADLDLVVGASQELQLAGAGPAHDVTGAVHPLSRRPERAGEEALAVSPGRSR